MVQQCACTDIGLLPQANNSSVSQDGEASSMNRHVWKFFFGLVWCLIWLCGAENAWTSNIDRDTARENVQVASDTAHDTIFVEWGAGISGELSREAFVNNLNVSPGMRISQHVFVIASLDWNQLIDFGTPNASEMFDGTAVIVLASCRYRIYSGWYLQVGIGTASLSTRQIVRYSNTGQPEINFNGFNIWSPVASASAGYAAGIFFVEYRNVLGLTRIHPLPEDNFPFFLFGFEFGFRLDLSSLL